MRRALDWCFRDRRTGRITVAQVPNAALWIFMAASALDWALPPNAAVAPMIKTVALGSLLVWAADEVLRGVNPWRRALGLGVLAYEAIKHW